MRINKFVSIIALTSVLSATPLLAFAEPSLTPISSVSIGEHSISPQSNIIIWRYLIGNGKIYKQLYDTTTDTWIGDWIYVGEYSP